MWTSAAGMSWQRVEPIFADPPIWAWGRFWAANASSGGDGLLSVESEAVANDPERPLQGIWTSGDGVRWRRVGELPRDATVASDGLMIRGGRLLVVGPVGEVDIGVWVGTPIG